MPANDDDKRLDPRILLSSDGSLKALKDVGSSLLSARIEEDLNAPAMFAIELSNWDGEKQTARWSDGKLLSIGSKIEILMGYANNKKQLLAGEITGLEPEFCADSLWTLRVRGHDLCHRLLRGRKTRSFRKMSDSAIAKKIAASVGLGFKGPAKQGIKLDYVLQRNQTDWEFLYERAQRLGYVMFARDEVLNFMPPANTKAAALKLGMSSKGLLSFSPRLSTMRQESQVNIQSWDAAKKKPVTAKKKDHGQNMGGKSSGFKEIKDFSSSSGPQIGNWLQPLVNQQEAESIALGRFVDMSLDYVTGEGVCIGNNELRVGIVVELNGLGDRFSGKYYVTSTTHTYSPGRGYRTAFTVRRNTA